MLHLRARSKTFSRDWKQALTRCLDRFLIAVSRSRSSTSRTCLTLSVLVETISKRIDTVEQSISDLVQGNVSLEASDQPANTSSS